MAQVKRQDSLGTLSDQTTFARLEDARVTVGGRQYKIDSLDSSAYSGLVNGTIYQVYVTAPSVTPELVITTLTPGTAYVQVGELYVGAGGVKTLITGNFPESSKKRTNIINQTSLGGDLGLDILVDFNSTPATGIDVSVQGFKDHNDVYSMYINATFSIAALGSVHALRLSNSTYASHSQSLAVNVAGGGIDRQNVTFVKVNPTDEIRVDFDLNFSGVTTTITGIVILDGKPTWFDENLDV